MSRTRKTLDKVLLGSSDSNIEFTDIRRLLEDLGFAERIKGSHHIFTRTDVAEIINIQPLNNKAKAYQIKQIRNIILRYRLGGEL